MGENNHPSIILIARFSIPITITVDLLHLDLFPVELITVGDLIILDLDIVDVKAVDTIICRTYFVCRLDLFL